MILGADGYIGFPLSMHLACKGFEVIGVDAFFRRKWVDQVGSHSATPITSMKERLSAFKETFGKEICFENGDLRNYDFVSRIVREYRPDTIIHLGEQPSAPFSMIDVDNAVMTQTNNLVSTLNILYAIKHSVPHCHLVKLGSMGEYGAVNMDIPEGFCDIKVNGRSETMMFPRHAFPDWYHWSKVYDSGNIMMACEIWGLKSSDIMQGIVYGTRTDEMVNENLLTRFDFDAVFGTFLNRFCAQAVLGHNLTVYGSGNQKRPIISLRDSIQCLTLVVENPPEDGEYRVFNQFDEVYSIGDVATRVKSVGDRLGLSFEVSHCENPRIENEQTPRYNPIHNKLYELGFRASYSLDEELVRILHDLLSYKSRIMAKSNQIDPNVSWDPSRVARTRDIEGIKLVCRDFASEYD